MSPRLRRSALVLLAGVAGLLGLALPALADPPARVGRLAEIIGTVSFHDSGADQWSPASLNYPVTSGNAFWTEPGASADLHVGSTAIHLDGSTELDITRLDDRRFDATLTQGTLNIRVIHFNNGDGYNITTPRGTVSLASPGTYRIVAGNDSDPTQAAVLEGAARVVDPTSAVSLTHGEEALLTGTGNDIDYQIVEAQPTPFDNASLARERREEEGSRPAAHYVSSEMTGYQDLDVNGAWQTDPSYGAVWYPRAVPADWAPYRYGHWRWVDPWGWTWIDDQPWGFAPFHYGRWAYIGDRWGWTPGAFAPRPVYAPALVAFVGGHGWSLSLSFGDEPAVGWFPLAPREVYVPSYPASVAYVRNVNVTNVTNVTNITNQTINNVNVTNVRHANQGFATVVPQTAFVGARPVHQAALNVPRAALVKAPVATGAPLAPAVAATSGHQEAVTRATRVAQAQGERIQGPPPQAVPAPAAAAATKPAPGPAIASRGRQPTGQAQPGQQPAAQPQAVQARPGRPQQPGQPPAASAPATAAAPGPPIAPRTGRAAQAPATSAPTTSAPTQGTATSGAPAPGPRTPANETVQTRPGGAPQPSAAAPGPPIAPRTGTAAQAPATSAPTAGAPTSGTPAPGPRTPANETVQTRPSGAPQPSAAAPGPPIAPRTGTAAQAPATSAPTAGAPTSGAPAPGPRTPANETVQTRPGGAPQPSAAAPGPPIQNAARPPGTLPPPTAQTGQTQNAPAQIAPPVTTRSQPVAPPAPPTARAPVEPPARAAARPVPQRPAATAAVPAPAARPPVTARAPAPPPVPERTVQRPVQQTVLQPTHQGWVRSPPPAPAAQPAAQPKAAPPAPAPAAKSAPAAAAKGAPAPAAKGAPPPRGTPPQQPTQ